MMMIGLFGENALAAGDHSPEGPLPNSFSADQMEAPDDNARTLRLFMQYI